MVCFVFSEKMFSFAPINENKHMNYSMKIRYFVIKPTYNQASFIRPAFKSLYNQTYQEWELIILNNGCTNEQKCALKIPLPLTIRLLI